MPYKGARVPHTVRLPADLHRTIIGAAREQHRHFNDIVVLALNEYFENRGRVVPEPVGVRHNQNVYDDEGRKVG